MVAKVRRPRLTAPTPHKIPPLAIRKNHTLLSALERREATIQYIREFDKMNNLKHTEYEMFGGRVAIK